MKTKNMALENVKEKFRSAAVVWSKLVFCARALRHNFNEVREDWNAIKEEHRNGPIDIPKEHWHEITDDPEHKLTDHSEFDS